MTDTNTAVGTIGSCDLKVQASTSMTHRKLKKSKFPIKAWNLVVIK